MRILVVEDEPAIAEQVAAALASVDYAVDRAADGASADFLVRTEQYDAVLLDLGLPRVDGLTLLRAWRDSGVHVPVLVLTARGAWHERVRGIDEGADDYVTKPFQIEEVVARLRGLIRRSSGQPSPVLRCGEIVLDARQALVTRGGAPVHLTSLEFRVLSYLMNNQSRIVPQAELIEHIYTRDADRDSNTVEVFVARLRRKLGPSLIETHRGLGYRMAAP